MSADLHIHVLDNGAEEKHLAGLQANTIGSKYCKDFRDDDYDYYNGEYADWDESYRIISETSNVWVGEVSWLKAAFLDDPKSFIPQPILKIHEIIGEDLKIIDDNMISEISDALSLKNKTAYSLSRKNKVLSFLKKHKGEKVFTVSW